MSILVTGGAGFIGSHLIERLLVDTDKRVVCLDNFNDYYSPELKRKNVAGFTGNPRVQIVEQTFCDLKAMQRLFEEEKIAEVHHFGAYAGVRPSIERPLIYQKANVEGTLCLLEAARLRPLRRFILASSSTVYGAGAAAPFVEDQLLGIPLSPYGATKRAAELLGLTYHQLHQVPVVCIRPFSIYGPRLRPDLAMTIFVKAILSGQRLPLFGDGSIRRDFTYITDFCDGVMAARDGDVVGHCINLGHSQPVEIRRLISLLEESLGMPAAIEPLPEKPGEMPITYADLTKARRLLGYEPKVAIEEGVKMFVDWQRQQS
ncbi:MAG: GDP-mannose 4,6-dehydratase [Planctomycetales bacterium]